MVPLWIKLVGYVLRTPPCPKSDVDKQQLLEQPGLSQIFGQGDSCSGFSYYGAGNVRFVPIAEATKYHTKLLCVYIAL